MENVANELPKNDLTDKLAGFKLVDLQSIYDAVMDEASEIKLDNEARKAACEELGVDMATARGWQTVSDIVKHVDLSELCEKHPDAAKSILVTTLGAVSVACPPMIVASGIAKVIPADVLTKVMGLSLKASPDHIIHILADYCTDKKRQALTEYDLEEEQVDNKRNLVVVCKDDLIVAQLKKLVETNDDKEGSIVGTEDGTVRIIRWDEDKWAYRYSKNNIKEKVLVIGDVKEAKNQVAVMEPVLDEFGAKYGWIGNVAYISANRLALKNKETYSEFVEKMEELQIPEYIKQDRTFKLNVKTGLKAALFAPILIKDAYDDIFSVLRQQYCYAAFKFYYSDMETFLNE